MSGMLLSAQFNLLATCCEDIDRWVLSLFTCRSRAYSYIYIYISMAVRRRTISSYALRKQGLSRHASSDAATDMFVSQVASDLRVICFPGISMEFFGVHNYGYVELGKAFATNLHPYDQVHGLLLCWQTADSNNRSDLRAFRDFLGQELHFEIKIYRIEGTGFKPANIASKRS